MLSYQFRRFERKLGRRPSVFSKDVLPNAVLSIDVSVPQIQEQRVEVQRGNPQERLQLRNSGNRQRLQNVWQKERVECRLPENCGSTSSEVTECSSESQKVQTATSDMNSQNVPKTVEVSKQQYTVMNVDVPAEMQRQITDTRRWCSKRRKHDGNLRKETLSNSNDPCRVSNDSGQRFEGYRSQYSDKASDASGVSRTP